MKKLISLALVMLMVLALNTMVMADQVDTIFNPSYSNVASDTDMAMNDTLTFDANVNLTVASKTDATYGARIYWEVPATSLTVEQTKVWNPATLTYENNVTAKLSTDVINGIRIAVVNTSNREVRFGLSFAEESNDFFTTTATLTDIDIDEEFDDELSLSTTRYCPNVSASKEMSDISDYDSIAAQTVVFQCYLGFAKKNDLTIHPDQTAVKTKVGTFTIVIVQPTV